jgi:hypothetical protein
MVNVFGSTPEWTLDDVIVNSGVGSHTACFSLDSASGLHDAAIVRAVRRSNHSSRCLLYNS